MKRVPFDALDERLSPLRLQGSRIVLCHGCFDLLHIGHVRHFRSAKLHGDILVVTLTADRHIAKGPGRPVYSHDVRAEFVAELSCVDFVSIVDYPKATEVIAVVRPHVYAKGGDFKELNDALRLEKAAVESFGGQLLFTDEERFTPVGETADVAYHSSDLLKRRERS